MPSVRLSWVVDRDEQCLERVSQANPHVHVSQRFDELLESSVDAVLIATPIRTHYPLAKAALLSGKHVMVEKPLAASSAECDELIDIAESRSLTLMVGHTFEYNAAIRALREIVQGGELGDIYYVRSSRLNLGLFQADVNVIWDLAPHDISILLYILRRDPTWISARGAAYIRPRVHDVAFLELGFPNNVLAHVHLSWLDPCKVRSVTIVGSRKMVVCDDLEDVEKIRIYDKGVDIPRSMDQLPFETHQFRDFHLSYRYGGISIPHVPFTEPLRSQCEHFVASIQTGTRPQSDGRVGRKVVALIEAANRSLRDGGLRESIALDPEAATISHEAVGVAQPEMEPAPSMQSFTPVGPSVASSTRAPRPYPET
jgi:predicted dehydrogenase